MISAAALRVLHRLGGGETLYQSGNRVYFSARRDGIVPIILVKSMIASGLLAPGPTHGAIGTLIMTPMGEEVRGDPVAMLPRIKRPMPSLGWFNQVADSVLGLEELKLHDLPPTGRCLVWTGSVDGGGTAKSSLQGTTVSLPRFMFEHTFGPLPAGARIKNVSCNDPRCINPYHWEDTAGVKDDKAGDRAMLAIIKRALVAGDDEAALGVLKSLRTVAPTVTDDEPEDTDLEEAIQFIWSTYYPNSWAEFWPFAQDVCTEEEAVKVLNKLGGDIAARCLRKESVNEQ